MTLVICGKTSQTVRSHRNYLYKAFSTLVEREKLSPCEAAVSELYRTFNRPTQYIQETKLRRSDRHFTCSGLSDISRRTETSGKWMSWGEEKELEFGYLRYFFRFVEDRSLRFSRIIVDSSSMGVMGHMFARCGRWGGVTWRGAGKDSDPLAVSAAHLAKSTGHSVYANFEQWPKLICRRKIALRYFIAFLPEKIIALESLSTRRCEIAN